MFVETHATKDQAPSGRHMPLLRSLKNSNGAISTNMSRLRRFDLLAGLSNPKTSTNQILLRVTDPRSDYEYTAYSYFQFRDLPWASHATAVLSRLARVSSRLASTSHSTYSRLWLGLNASNVASAFLFFLSAVRK
jgi:hypothetical protein